jgi:hypothetical protein
LSFLILPTDEWKSRFLEAQEEALLYWYGPKNYSRKIARGVLTPEVARACLKLYPHLDKEKYFPRRLITTPPEKIEPEPIPKPKKKQRRKRGSAWKSHRSEKQLWRSSKASFNHLLYRAQLPDNPDYFPWAEVSIKSLMKYTEYSHCQVTRALAQLERFKRIKRIVVGNEFQGASKYLVFFTPEMSRAFSWKAAHRKKNQRHRKRTHRIR